jgi:hypothetical protein
MKMDSDDMQYLFDNVKKCYICKKCILYRGMQTTYYYQKKYVHIDCYNMLIKRMEMLGILQN